MEWAGTANDDEQNFDSALLMAFIVHRTTQLSHDDCIIFIEFLICVQHVHSLKDLESRRYDK